MKEMSASELTKYAINYLSIHNVVWRQNNIHTPGRKFIGMKGLPDIIGYSKRGGHAIYCEVKKIGDKISQDQKDFLTYAEESGCMVYIAHEIDGQPMLSKWSEYDKG